MRHLVLFIFIATTSLVQAYRITDVKDIAGNESEITEINLSNKGITLFPQEILKCKNLKSLDLSNNGFVKVPMQLGTLKHLERLDFSENPNISPLSLMDLLDSAQFSLKELSLAECGLVSVPESVGEQKSLVKLDLSGNRLSILPHSMMTFTQLRDLNLADNHLKDVRWFLNYWWALRNIDLSGNEELEIAGALYNLSFFDHLNKVTVSHVTKLPKEFVMFGANELIFEQSALKGLPRDKDSPKIRSVKFVNCKFKDADEMVKILNTQVKPERIAFQSMSQKKLIPFLKLRTDSLDLRMNGLTDISALAKIKNLKWVDIRGNQVTSQSVDYLTKANEDLDVLYMERVQENIGIHPPIVKFTPKPKKTKMTAEEGKRLQIGKTQFDIPKDAFLTASGKVYQGPVQLEYEEYMNPVQNFLSGIAMTATEDGEAQMFSSGGMFKISATDTKGNELQVNPDNPIDVQVGSSSDLDMSLWYMDENGVWQKKGETKVLPKFKLDQSKIDSIEALGYYHFNRRKITFTRDRYVPVISETDKFGKFTIKFEKFKTVPKAEKVTITPGEIEVKNVEYSSDFIANATLNFDGDSVEFYQERLQWMRNYCLEKYAPLLKTEKKQSPLYTKEGPNFISELSLIADEENDGFRLHFQFKDSVVNIPVLAKTYSDQPKDMMNSSSKFYKRYQAAERDYSKEIVKNFRVFEKKLRWDGKYQKEQAIKMEKQRQRNLFEKDGLLGTQVDESSIVRAFTLSSFGLWNCDVRSRMSEPTQVATNLISVSGEDLNKPTSKVVIIDHDKNGVVTFKTRKEAFFDRATKSTIVFFFSAVSVGIFQSWKNKRSGQTMELNPINIDNVTVEEFENLLTP